MSREEREKYIHDEQERILRGYTIAPEGCPGTPEDFTVFDDSYMRDYDEDLVRTAPVNPTDPGEVDYSSQLLSVRNARKVNPYRVAKDLGVDYRFWNAF